MSDYDRWRGGRERTRGLSERGNPDHDFDRSTRGEDRPDHRRQQSGRDFRGDREPGATDLAFGNGFGSGYAGRDRSGLDEDRQFGQSDRDRGYDAGSYGSGSGYEAERGGAYGRGSYNDAYGRRRGELDATGYRGERGFFERAGDEMASWVGDRDATRRREEDARHGDAGAQHHAGKGPRNYQRSDERIRDDINDRLTDDRMVDATDIEVTVQNREVTLSGTVGDRHAKRRAEDVAESVSGVSHVQNNLRVSQVGSSNASGQSAAQSGVAGGARAVPGQVATAKSFS